MGRGLLGSATLVTAASLSNYHKNKLFIFSAVRASFGRHPVTDTRQYSDINQL